MKISSSHRLCAQCRRGSICMILRRPSAAACRPKSARRVRVGGERRVSLARHRDVGFKRLRQAEGVQPRAQNKQTEVQPEGARNQVGRLWGEGARGEEKTTQQKETPLHSNASSRRARARGKPRKLNRLRGCSFWVANLGNSWLVGAGVPCPAPSMPHRAQARHRRS